MKLFDIFSNVKELGADEIKKTLEAAKAGEITLVDVREPSEYEEGHLPGAVHIPLSQLPDRTGEINRAKPVITY